MNANINEKINAAANNQTENMEVVSMSENKNNVTENIIPEIPVFVMGKNREMLHYIVEENGCKVPKNTVWEEHGLKGYNFAIELDKAWKNAGRYYAYGFQSKHQNTALVHLERAYKLVGLEWNASQAWDMYIANGLLRVAKDKVTKEEYMTVSSKNTMTKKSLKMFYRMVCGKSVILTNETLDKALSESTARKGKKAQTNEEKLKALLEVIGMENAREMFKELFAA